MVRWLIIGGSGGWGEGKIHENWTDKEVQQLLDDIDEQIDGGSSREYFIGTIIVASTAEKNHYEVIDGQQRLTTFFLLLLALKNLFQGQPQCQTIGGLISTSYT